ncbi:hypothetical protein OIU77_022696 [Salix suchowensis]|uniref:Ribosomal protein S16 n=1 Tax=Salix suchowensis TaxID=1278906 RepID=A0ABQ9C134_9ROSI|nr:hypothetical protein OIU77_022696 [Salix suchowensis]
MPKGSFLSCGVERDHNSSKLSAYVAVSIFIDEPRKNEKQRQKRAVDFLSRLLKKNEKQLQRLQRKKHV